jgi:hypothetical protein
MARVPEIVRWDSVKFGADLEHICNIAVVERILIYLQSSHICLSDNSGESLLTKPAFESAGFTTTCHQPFEGIGAYSGGKTIGMREDKYAQQDHHHHAAVKRNQQAPFGRWGR